MVHTVKGFSVVNEAEVDVFLEFSCFFYDPTYVGNSISDSSTFSKSILKIWTVSVHILLKPSLENFEHYFASMWDECNCAVVWTFFDIAFLWNWNENWPFPVPKKGNAKECSNYHTITLISDASKGMLKILQARLQQYVNCKLPDVQAGFRKCRETRDQIASTHWIIEKAREFQKNTYFCFTGLDFVWITTNCGKFFKR